MKDNQVVQLLKLDGVATQALGKSHQLPNGLEVSNHRL